MYTAIKYIRALALGLTALLAFQSCKKTENIPFEQQTANRILEYKVDNASEPLYGVIDNIDNTITVSLPYYLSIDYIAPKIKLSEGAKLVDKNDNVIDLKEDLEPVKFDEVGYTYRIKDANNVTRTYTLITDIYPHQDRLKAGYGFNPRGTEVDTVTPKDVVINATFAIYGNFQSSSRNGIITITDKKTNKVIPNAMQITDVRATSNGHAMTLKLASSLDSGSYAFSIEHQGRKANLPTLHLIHRKPQFEYLGKQHAIGDTVTITVRSNFGVNTGVKRLYIFLKKSLFDWSGPTALPANFPQDLLDKPIEVKVVGQNRTQVKFVFPELPVGRYVNYLSASSNSGLLDSSFGFYMDFDSPEWGNGNLVTMAASVFEILPKK